MDLSDYERAYYKAIIEMKHLCEANKNVDGYRRNQLWKDYQAKGLDPDGKAIRDCAGVKCTADGLLSIYRICKMEPDENNIVNAYERYRKTPIFNFPCEQGGINQTRASVFGDKIDWTLQDLKKFYSGGGVDCLLSSAYMRPKTASWLAGMESFEKLVDWYGIKGIFTDETYNVYDLENGTTFDNNADAQVVNKEWSFRYYQNLKDKIDLWYESKAKADGYSEIYYMDEAGHACDEKDAKRCMIREYDAAGNLINEINGLC